MIAVIDGGVDFNHPDLRGKLIPGLNYHAAPDEPERYLPQDEDGHGTIVAGIAAARTNNAIGMAGVAWYNPILVMKTQDVFGWGDPAFLADAIRRSADWGAKIINVSLYSILSNSAVSKMVDYAHKKGALIVGCAGNEGSHRRRYPAAYEEVIGVGTSKAKVDSEGNVVHERASSSNHGYWVDLASPMVSFSTTSGGEVGC